MYLRFGGSGADRRPRYQIGRVLRHDRVQEFCSRRQAQFRYGKQQTSRPTDTLFDIVGVVQAGVVQHALPAQRRARFLKVGPHDYQNLIADLILQLAVNKDGVIRGNDTATLTNDTKPVP